MTHALAADETVLELPVWFRRWSLYGYLLLLASLCALEIALGSLPTRIYGHDFYILLDGAWRIACGQVPNVDFYAGYGVLVLNPIRWALGLDHFHADAIGLARAFYTAMIGGWFLWLSRILLRRTQLMVAGFFLLIFISAARPLGEYPTWISHAMFYNRVGYAFLLLILIEQFAGFFDGDVHAVKADGRRMYFWRGVSTGAAIACTILTKISFVAPALIILGLGLLLFGLRRRQAAGLLLGAAATFLVAVSLLHFHPAAFLRETMVLSHQRARITDGIVNTVVEESGLEFFVLASGVAVASFAGFPRREGIAYLLATAAVLACDIFCRATNAMRGDLPLAAFWGLWGALLLVRRYPSSEQPIRPQRWLTALLVLGPMAVQVFLADFASTVYAAVATLHGPRNVALRLESPRLNTWLPQNWQGEDPNYLNANGTPLVLRTNDGIDLLKSFSRQEETVSTIAFSNPFSFALSRRPPEGGALWLDLDNNVSTRHPVAEKIVIGHPDLLLVEHSADREGHVTEVLLSLYPDLIGREFAHVADSKYWSLYRRRRCEQCGAERD